MILKPFFTDKVASPHPSIKETEAIGITEQVLPGTYNNHPVKLEYFAKEDGSVALVYTIQIQDTDKNVWLEAYVDAHTGKLVSSTNFVAEAAVSLSFYDK